MAGVGGWPLSATRSITRRLGQDYLPAAQAGRDAQHSGPHTVPGVHRRPLRQKETKRSCVMFAEFLIMAVLTGER